MVWNAFDTTISFPPGVPSDIAGYRVSASLPCLPTGKTTGRASGVVQNPGSPLILTTYASPHQVDMVYNVAMDEYFLAFVVVHTQATIGNDIYGLRVSWNGTPVNPPGLIHVYNLAKNQNAPAVATNQQNRYIVVWEHEYSSTDHDTYGREYDALGNPVGSYFTIASWTQNDTVPDVAANGANNGWLAAWQRALPLACRQTGAAQSMPSRGSAGAPGPPCTRTSFTSPTGRSWNARTRRWPVTSQAT